MTQYNIAVVVGSLRRDSINRRLAQAVIRLAPAEFTCKIVKIDDLPLYNQDDEGDICVPVTRLRQEIFAAQGVIFVTPEYNRSIPGVLKNAIDHPSRPYGKNAWAGKPAGIMGASGGAIGTALAQQHLRNILSYLDVPTLSQPELYLSVGEGFFDADGNITNESTRQLIQGWMDKYVAWVKLFSA